MKSTFKHAGVIYAIPPSVASPSSEKKYIQNQRTFLNRFRDTDSLLKENESLKSILKELLKDTVAYHKELQNECAVYISQTKSMQLARKVLNE